MYIYLLISKILGRAVALLGPQAAPPLIKGVRTCHLSCGVYWSTWVGLDVISKLDPTQKLRMENRDFDNL
jgi:hypothetical protein